MGRWRGQAMILSAELMRESRKLALERPSHSVSFALQIALNQDLGFSPRLLAKLKVGAFTDAEGRPTGSVYVSDQVAGRSGAGRILVLPKDCRRYVRRLLDRYGDHDPIAISPASPVSDPRPMTAGAIGKSIARLYRSMGLQGYSSHSGPRTFASRIAPRLREIGAGLEDLQRMMGHAKLETTLRSVDLTEDIACGGNFSSSPFGDRGDR